MPQHGWILPERPEVADFSDWDYVLCRGHPTDLRSQDADWEAAASGLFETSPCTSSEHCFVPATKSSQMGTNHLGRCRYIYHLHNVYVHVCTMFALLCTVFIRLYHVILIISITSLRSATCSALREAHRGAPRGALRSRTMPWWSSPTWTRYRRPKHGSQRKRAPENSPKSEKWCLSSVSWQPWQLHINTIEQYWTLNEGSVKLSQ